QLFVSNTKLLDNSSGGVLIKPSGAATAALDHVAAEANQFGVKIQDNAQVSISNSLASGNTQNGMQTLTTGAAAHVDLVNDIASNNGMNGVTSEGVNSQVTYSGLTATGNSSAGTLSVNGTLTASGTNEIADDNRGFTPISLAVA